MKYNWKWKIFGRSWNRTSGLLVTPPTELQQTVYLPFKRFSYLAADFGPLLVDILFLPGHYLKPKVRNLKFSLASKFWKPGLLSSLPSLSSSFFKFLGRNLWTETKCDQVEFRCQTAAVDKTGISLIDSSSRSLWPTWGETAGQIPGKGSQDFLRKTEDFKMTSSSDLEAQDYAELRWLQMKFFLCYSIQCNNWNFLGQVLVLPSPN